jgi:hypothetical protein
MRGSRISFICRSGPQTPKRIFPNNSTAQNRKDKKPAASSVALYKKPAASGTPSKKAHIDAEPVG